MKFVPKKCTTSSSFATSQVLCPAQVDDHVFRKAGLLLPFLQMAADAPRLKDLPPESRQLWPMFRVSTSAKAIVS